jgi:Ras-related protein Rab-1A
MVVFDKNSPDSFKHVDDWMEEVNRYGHENAVKMMIGNKADLSNAVSKEEAEDKARSFGIEYVETSAKNSYQVDLAFMNVARQLVKKRKETGVPPIPRMPKLVLANEEAKSKDSSCC